MLATIPMEPTMRMVLDANGVPLWIVEGLGMVFSHRQQWQAEVKLHCLQSSAGVSTTASPPRDLGSTAAGSATN